MLSLGSPNFDILKWKGIFILYFPFSISIHSDFKKMLKISLWILNKCADSIHHTFPLWAYCTNSRSYQVFSFKFTFFTLFPFLSIWVTICMKPFLWVNTAGILSPILQQLLSDEVTRRISANCPLARLSPSKELMYKLRDTLNNGPQLGSVANRFSWPMGVPSMRTEI